MEERILRGLAVALGVPGVALGILYLLFRSFHWSFPVVPAAWVGPIIILFLLIVGTITFFALKWWRPAKGGPTGETRIAVTIPAGWKFRQAAEMIAGAQLVQFEDFHNSELDAPLSAREFRAKNARAALKQLRLLANGAVRAYSVEQDSSESYVLSIDE